MQRFLGKTFFFILSCKSIEKSADTGSPDVDETGSMNGVSAGATRIDCLKKRPSCATTLLKQETQVWRWLVGWWSGGGGGGADDGIGPGNMQAELRQDLVQLGQGCGRAPPTEQ